MILLKFIIFKIAITNIVFWKAQPKIEIRERKSKPDKEWKLHAK